MTIVTRRIAYGGAGSSGFVVMSAEKLKDLKVHVHYEYLYFPQRLLYPHPLLYMLNFHGG